MPTDIAALHAIIAQQAADLAAERQARACQDSELAAAKAGLVVKALEVEKLKAQLARLRRMQFDRFSEKIDREIEQLELTLEELEATPEAQEAAAAAEIEADTAAASPGAPQPRRRRRKLPEHLPRTDIVHEPAEACPDCGGALRRVGEDVTEVLDYIPGRFTVIRHVRPARSCRCCETMVQAPMPSLPIERGLPSAGLLAHVLIGKYCDHLPLYRQSLIYAREGVTLERARQEQDRPAVGLSARRTPACRASPAGRAVPLYARPTRRPSAKRAGRFPRAPACRWLCRLHSALPGAGQPAGGD